MKNIWCLYLSRILNEIFSVFCRVIFCGVFKAAFHWNNLKFFFEKLKKVFIILDFELKNFGNLLKVFRRCCQNRTLCVPRNILYLLEEIVFFVSCSDVDREEFGILSGNIRRGCQNCFLCFHGSVSKKNFFLDYLVHRTNLKTKKFSERIMIFSNCSDFELQVCRFLSTIFCGVFKAASYVFIATYWRKILFWIFLFFKNYRKLGKKTFALVPNKIR